jgi:dihydrofolate reductase
VSFGNKQDVFVNSNLNLQMQGELGDGVKLNAVISDQNVPFQPEGNTQNIQEFDQIFINLDHQRWSLKAGDLLLQNNDNFYLKYFKKTTEGKTVVMGRKTYESIGRPLPNRENIILTRDRNYVVDGCKVIHNKEELNHDGKDVFIIGGSEIFKLFFNDVDKMYVTHIQDVFEGDSYFHHLNHNDWQELYRIDGIRNKDNPYHYHFSVYQKKVIKEPYKRIYWIDEL